MAYFVRAGWGLLLAAGMGLAGAATVTPVSRSAPDSVFASANGASDTSPARAVSVDGNRVVFVSSATNLVPGQADLNGQPDVFLLDRASNTITLISHRFGNGTAAGDGAARNPVISADGSRIAFISTATDLLQDPLPQDSSLRLFLYDVAAQTLTQVDRHLGDPSIGASFSGGAGFSTNGQWLVFGSSATDLVVDQDDQNNSFDVFLYDVVNQNLRLVSHTPSLFNDTTAGNGGSGLGQISADGRFITYASSATDIASGVTDFNDSDVDIFVFDRDAPSSNPTALVSHSASSNQFTANGASDNPTISADGSAVAFTTQGTNLVAGVSDANGDSDVYVYDRVTRALTLVSHNATSNLQTSVQYSGNPALSPDGRYVVHTSASADVLTGQVDGSKSDDLFLFDRTNASLKLLSHAAGAPLTAGSNETKLAFFTADGSRILALSRAANLVAGQVDTNDDDDPLLGDDVYWMNPANPDADAHLVSHAIGQPAVAGKRMSYTPSANTDGSLVVYVSESDELPGPGADANAATDLLLWSAGSDSSSLLTRHAAAADPATLMGASQVQVSRDGNWIVFVSPSAAVVAGEIDTNRESDLYLLNRANGTVRLVSHVPGNALQAGNRGVALTTSSNVSISADGRWVAFETNASDLAAGELDNNLRPDVVLFDRDAPAASSLRLLSRKSVGGSGNAASTVPRVSADGSAVVFLSEATNLLAGVTDGNGTGDLYRYDVATSTLQLASHAAGSSTTTADGQAKVPAISDDGRYVAYLDSGTNLLAGQSDANGTFDVFLFDAQDGSNRLVSHAYTSATTAAGAGGVVNQAPVIDAAGDVVAYASEAANLVSNFQNNIDFPIGVQTQLYRWSRASDTNQLISRRPDGFGNPSGNGAAYLPSLSGDGQRIAFNSQASDLIDGQQDDPITDDAFLWDAAGGGSLRLITHAVGQPLQATQSAHDGPVLSVDGARVVYGSNSAASAAQTTLPDSEAQLFLYAVDGDISVLVSSHVLDAHAGAGAYADHQAVDGSATSIVFLSPSSDLIDFDGNAFGDAFLFRRGTGQPQLTAPGDATLPEDAVAGPLAVPASDPDTPLAGLSLSVTSSDTVLLPPENIVVTATPGGYELTATPATEAAGSSTLTLTLVDGDANVARASFTLTWTPVNDPPTLAAPAGQTTGEDTPLGPLAITVGDVESGPDGVVLTATSSNQAIVPDANLVVGGSSADRTLDLLPAQDASGSVTITLTAHDPVDGSITTVATFPLTVTPVNDAPFVIPPLDVGVVENGHSDTLHFGVADIESASSALNLQVATSNPGVVPLGGVAWSGTDAIRTLVVTPAVNAVGSSTITLTVTDPEGATRSASFTVNVSAANQSANLQISVGNGRDWVGQGQPTTWTVHVHNAGPAAVAGSRLTDLMPAGVTAVAWTCLPGAGAACGTGNGSGPLDVALDLAVGASVDVLVTATPGAGAADPFVYSASIAPASGVHEADLADNSAVDSDAFGDYLFRDGFDGVE